MKHVLQYNDGGADWCVNCGTFREWLTGECSGEAGRFDFSQPKNWDRQAAAMFGEDAVAGAQLTGDGVLEDDL